MAVQDALDRGQADARAGILVAGVQALVDFTNPTRSNVNEVVVTGPGAPAIASADDLSGQDVFARKDSKYYASLVALNERLKGAGKPEANLVLAADNDASGAGDLTIGC